LPQELLLWRVQAFLRVLLVFPRVQQLALELLQAQQVGLASTLPPQVLPLPLRPQQSLLQQ
jgi:hypothetical protein